MAERPEESLRLRATPTTESGAIGSADSRAAVAAPLAQVAAGWSPAGASPLQGPVRSSRFSLNRLK